MADLEERLGVAVNPREWFELIEYGYQPYIAEDVPSRSTVNIGSYERIPGVMFEGAPLYRVTYAPKVER